MGRRRTVAVSGEQRHVLARWLATAPKAYLRERAAAILKVADGMPAAQVAAHGLLRPHDPDTVYAWIDRFEAAGVDGLLIRTGRGRKPAFSPSERASGQSRALGRGATRATPAGGGPAAHALDARHPAGGRA